ncbi:CPBP family intramembrane glutamic endopeptidase [Altererythrobacter lutimaris]|uniref:CPBP family intramembrane metalloprotease n=1 Tax=Altererythrobacter lutimaris TaxID=2743979 RepID=A0A850H7A2_9SPHN|nr:CPBP family intramembrane glutamic endopeptidase [Altererythrobacter lutimaris]NVE95047.1 CPBP family intramembrane metalloprotease [Altererythrobacter lutimaris]
MLLQELVDTTVQLAVGFVLAAAIWAVFGRKRAPFTQWVGLTRPSDGWLLPSAVILLGLGALSAVFIALGPLGDLATGPGTVGGKLQEQGFTPAMIGVIALGALIKTGFTEELIFRGLIAKRLINWLGFKTGNAIQAILFGAVHLVIFAVPGAPEPHVLTIATLFGLPALAGWCMGYANEKFGGGSIVPGWLIHAGGNFASYLHFAL